MALIKCVECGKKISDKAKACPYCGAPNEKPTKKVVIVYREIFAIRCSVAIDNETIGQMGVHSKKSIELDLPVGKHNITIITQIKHHSNVVTTSGNKVLGVGSVTTAISEERDGEQFEIKEDKDITVIEIKSKASLFESKTGRCVIGSINNYTNSEYEAIKENQKKTETKAKANNKKMYIVLGIIIFILFVVFLINKNSLSPEEQKVYKFLKANNYALGGGDTTFGFVAIDKTKGEAKCFNMNLKEISCSKIPAKLTNDRTRLDEIKINAKLGYK